MAYNFLFFVQTCVFWLCGIVYLWTSDARRHGGSLKLPRRPRSFFFGIVPFAAAIIAPLHKLFRRTPLCKTSSGANKFIALWFVSMFLFKHFVLTISTPVYWVFVLHMFTCYLLLSLVPLRKQVILNMIKTSSSLFI